MNETTMVEVRQRTRAAQQAARGSRRMDCTLRSLSTRVDRLPK